MSRLARTSFSSSRTKTVVVEGYYTHPGEKEADREGRRERERKRTRRGNLKGSHPAVPICV